MNKNISLLDFSKMNIRVDNLKETDSVVDKYHMLSVFPCFKKLKNPLSEKIIRVIILLYTPESPFVALYLDITERQKECLKYLNIPLTSDNKVPDYWQQILDYKNEEVIEVVDTYIHKIVNHYDFNMLISSESVYYETQQMLRTPISNMTTNNGDNDDKKKIEAIEKKEKLMKLALQSMEQIKTARQLIYQGNSELEKVLTYRRVKPENMTK